MRQLWYSSPMLITKTGTGVRRSLQRYPLAAGFMTLQADTCGPANPGNISLPRRRFARVVVQIYKARPAGGFSRSPGPVGAILAEGVAAPAREHARSSGPAASCADNAIAQHLGLVPP